MVRILYIILLFVNKRLEGVLTSYKTGPRFPDGAFRPLLYTLENIQLIAELVNQLRTFF
jgi:hypothetical protein